MKETVTPEKQIAIRRATADDAGAVREIVLRDECRLGRRGFLAPHEHKAGRHRHLCIVVSVLTNEDEPRSAVRHS